MNWFERHLNLSILILFAMSLILGCLCAEIIITFIGVDYSLSNLVLVFWGLFIFSIISFFCFYWVLNKKHRSYIFLLFFLPLSVAPIITGFSLDLNFYVFLEKIIVYFGAGILIWLIGLIIILSLRNRSKSLESDAVNVVAIDKPIFRLFPKHPRIAHVFIWSLITAIVITGVLAGNGYLEPENYYNEYIGQTYGSMQEPQLFSFKYPSYCEVGSIHDFGPSTLFDVFVFCTYYERKWFVTQERKSMILFLNPNDYDYIAEGTSAERGIEYLFFPGGAQKAYDEREVIREKMIMVDNIAAQYLVIKFDKPLRDSCVTKVTETVYFEHLDYIWLIYIDHHGDEIPEPDPDFEHLLKTFRVLQ